ncbi:MAG: amidohydrolase family protein, partial [Deltaproteobacteria bacterium]|nr:amidohydrolase family protein [Deltaproteobacteria bacterium]
AVELAWLDNGRGPRVRARLKLAADGTLAALEIKGTDTFGVALDESLAVQGGRARWKSHADAGARTLPGPAFYLPVSPLPAATGLLAAATVRAGGRLPLLPQGEARAEKEAETTIRGRHLTLYAVSGLDYLPTRVWLDDDRGFFGIVDPWWSIVREGWEDAIGPLVAIEKELRARRERTDAARLAHRPPAAGLAIVHARVFDAAGKRWLPDHTVVVKGGRIQAVGPSARLAPPRGAEIIDAAGKALLPGLWDMHVHLSAVDGPLNIAAGVTTVRDMDNDPDRLADHIRRIDAGQAIGPRVLRVGLVEGVGPSSASTRFNIQTEAEGRKALDYYASHGYVQLKFYNSTSPALIPPLARAAHERGLRVSGHVPFGMLAEDVVRAGYDEIQHLNQVVLNFVADRKTDTRTLVRFTLPGERAAGLDLGSRAVTDFIALLREHRTVIDPTIAVFESTYRARPGVMDPSVAAVADRLPPLVARSWLTGGLVAPGEKDRLYRRSFAAMLALVGKLHAAGVPLVPGTDGMCGFYLHRELELFVQAGVPPGDALQAATLGAARVMRREGRSGSITAGKDADLVLIDGDPLARMSDVRRVVTVVKDGLVFDAAAVYASVGVRPWTKR